MKLGDVSKGRSNNLDLIRFCAALMVIFCHAYPISQGRDAVDFLGELTQGEIHMGGLAVCVFFLIGGFLISKSIERIKVGGKYFKARAIKICPCLGVVVLVCTFLIGPIITEISVNEYFSSKDTYKYLLNVILIPTHSLPGVFENNIYGNVINGSLWTLPVEVVCYVLCFIAYKLNFFKKEMLSGRYQL